MSTNSTITTITHTSSRPKCWMPRANSVSGSRTRARAAIAPYAVSAPARSTSTRAVPLRTEVPRNTAFVRCASGASAGTSSAGRFATGNDSPVRLGSVTRKSVAASTRPSAGIG